MKQDMPNPPRKKSHPFVREWQMNYGLFILLLPGLTWVFLFNYLPLPGIVLAFQEFKIIAAGNFFLNLLKCKWVWFDNFWIFFHDKYFMYAVRTTVLYNLLFMVTGTCISLTIAIMINEMTNRRTAKFFHSCMLLPYFLSWVVFSYVVFAFLGMEKGFVNRSILAPLGLSKISWYSEPKYWPYILFLVNTIKGAGYGSILYLSAIVGINPEYYEAARINGASKWQQIVHITLPMVSNMVIILIILSLGSILSGDFGMFYNVPLRSSMLRKSTEIIDIYVYRLLQGGRWGVSTASSLLKSAIGMMTVLSANLVVRKIDSEKSLF